MSNKLFSCVIKAQSSQKARLLSALNKAQIVVWEVKTESNYITFSLKIKDLAKTFAILKNMCYNYTVCSRKDFRWLCKSVLKRVGLLMGTALSVACIVVCSNLVLGCKVKTNNEDLKTKVLSLPSVKNCLAKFKSNVSTDIIKSEVSAVDGVASCVVKIVGNFLVVDLVSTPRNEEREFVYSSYVSKYDATITSIVATRGTPLVKIGDRVFAGAQLISPNVYNESGEVVATTGVSGKVFGEIVLRKTIVVDKFQSVLVKTGKRKEYRSISLKPPVIPSPYSLYEKTITTRKFNLFVPILYTVTKYEEKEERSVEINVEEYAKSELNKFVIESGHIGEESGFYYKENEKGYEISLYLKSTTEIGIGV